MKSPFQLTSILNLALGLSLTCTLPALADLEGNLQHMPANPDAFFTLNTDYKHWEYFLNREPLTNWIDDILEDLGQDLKQELGLDLKHDLLPLIGTHFSVAFYQSELKQGENLPVLVAMDVKDQQAYKVFIKALTQAADRDPKKNIVTKKYLDRTLYGFTRQTSEQGALHIALSGHTVIIGSEKMLKKAIDLSQLDGIEILKNQHFKPVHDALKNKQLWVYLNPESLSTSVKAMPETKALKRQDIQNLQTQINSSYAIYDALGFGLDLSANGLLLKSVSLFKEKGLSPKQADYVTEIKSTWAKKGTPLRSFIQGSPRRPLLFLGLDGLNAIAPFQMLATNNNEGQKMQALVQKEIKAITGLDLQKDLINHSDGRSGLVVFYPEVVERFDHPPQVLMFLGVKNKQEILKTMTQKLAVDLSSLQKTGIKQKTTPSSKLHFKPKPVSQYDGYPVYQVADHTLIRELKQSIYFEPAFTLVDDLLIVASNTEALKHGIDYLKGRESNLLSSSYFNRMVTLYNLEEKTGMMFMDLTQILRLMEFAAGEDEAVSAIKPSLRAFRSVIAGGQYHGNLAEGYLIVDVDMNRVDFKLIGDLISSGKKDASH